MVIGTIIEWSVYRTLDLTLGTLWWVTKATGQGIFSAGAYMTGYVAEKPKEEITLTELKTLKEQNELLKEQNSLLKHRTPHQTSDQMSAEAPF